MSVPSNIAVIGAGIVGLSTALWLLRLGLSVTLIDRDEPGHGTSFGNAGVFADYARIPFANYGQLRQIPGMLLDRQSPLSLQTRYLPALLPYGWHFFRACSPRRVSAGCEALTWLQRTAVADDEVLLGETGAAELVRRSGAIALVGTAEGLAAATAGHFRQREALGARVQLLSAAEVAQLEPGLAPFYAGGVLYPNTRFTVSPIGISRRYAAHFAANGGRLLRDEVQQILDGVDGCELRTSSGHHRFDRVVVCAGVEGARLARQLGLRIPLASERGYHLMLEGNGPGVSRPVVWLDKATFLTPMEDGLRVAGTAEFAAPGTPPDPGRTALMLDNAARMLGRTPRVASSWVGSRPSTPDSLPLIGPVPGHPRFTLAFGHGHLGLTLSSVTGRLVAESILGTQDPAALAPFSPARFSSGAGSHRKHDTGEKQA